MNIAGTGSFCPNLHVVVGAKLSPWITTVVPPQVGPDVGPAPIVAGAAMARSPAPLSSPSDDPSRRHSSAENVVSFFVENHRVCGTEFDAILSEGCIRRCRGPDPAGPKPRSTPRLQYTFAPG